MEKFKKIFDVLDLTKNNGLFILEEDDWQLDCNFSKRIEHLIKDVLKPYAFYYFNQTPFVFFFNNPTNLEQLEEQIWNFNQTPVVFINHSNQIHIRNGFSYIKTKKKKGLAELANFDKDLNDFEYFKIVTGETWEKYQKQLKREQRVDYKLLHNVKTLRNQLTNQTENFSKIANNLIGRILFIRYLIDRKVRIQKKLWTNEDLCKVLEKVETTYELFEYLQSKDNYNGDLFPLEDNERQIVTNAHLVKIIQLLKGTDLEKGQLSLFDIYDFSIIPVELVSNVYEFFIGKKNQQSKGAYYTPLFLVNYILEETVGNFIDKRTDKYNCKVLDPSCGSGIFLVETLRKVIQKYLSLHPDAPNNKEKYHKKLRNLLTDNIYGIDIDGNAVNVAIFSLYITLLDFIDKPADIEDFKFPNVLNTNFFEANFFDLDALFNEFFEEKPFDFIVGNPPWGKGEGDNKLFKTYWTKREKKESFLLQKMTSDKKTKVKIKVSNEEISEAFLIRVSDFADKSTNFSFIIKSRTLYKSNTKDFRKYLLSNFKVKKLLELSSVRHEVFDKSNKKATHPAAVIFYQYTPNNHNQQNLIQHISLKPNRFFELFKLFVVEKFDVKNVLQYEFLKYDWLWKTLVYGNILDFHLIRKLKKHITIEDVALVINGFQRGKEEYPETKGWNILKHRGKSKLKNFNIFLDTNEKNENINFQRIGNLDNYKNLKILLSDAFDGHLLKSAITEEAFLFPKSYYAILNPKIQELKIIQSVLSSSIFSYWLVCISSYYGIERPIFLLDEIKKVPIEFGKTGEILKIIEELIILHHLNKIGVIEKIFSLMTKLNQLIFDNYNISNQEIAVIEYANEVTIPSIHQKKKYEYLAPIKLNEKGKSYLVSYAQIISTHFNHLFRKANKKIQVNIYHSKHTIGVEFCVVDKANTRSNVNFIVNNDSKQMLTKFALLSYEKLSEDLFIQKDIKGFEEESFYVIKPNEYKCWHRAIGHLDLGELLEATLKAGAKQKRAKQYAQ